MAGPDGEALSVGMNLSGMGATVAGPDGEMVSVDMNMNSMGATIAGPDGEMVSVGMNLEGLGMDLAMGGTVTETTTVTTTTTTEPVMMTHEPLPSIQEPVRAVPSHVTLVFRSTDGEWADVVINGKVMAEFRNEDEISVRVKSGKHTVEIREFMKDDSYTRAKIDTGVADEVVVGITEGQPLECYNHEGCY